MTNRTPVAGGSEADVIAKLVQLWRRLLVAIRGIVERALDRRSVVLPRDFIVSPEDGFTGDVTWATFTIGLVPHTPYGVALISETPVTSDVEVTWKLTLNGTDWTDIMLAGTEGAETHARILAGNSLGGSLLRMQGDTSEDAADMAGDFSVTTLPIGGVIMASVVAPADATNLSVQLLTTAPRPLVRQAGALSTTAGGV